MSEEWLQVADPLLALTGVRFAVMLIMTADGRIPCAGARMRSSCCQGLL